MRGERVEALDGARGLAVSLTSQYSPPSPRYITHCIIPSILCSYLYSAAADAEGRTVAATGGSSLVLPPPPPADDAPPAGYPEEKEEPVHDMDTS